MGIGGQIGAVIWLWRAHNAVSERLRLAEIQSDGSSHRAANGYPDAADCEACYNVSAGGEAMRKDGFKEETIVKEAGTPAASQASQPKGTHYRLID